LSTTESTITSGPAVAQSGITATINQIDTATLQYAPMAIGGIIAAQTSAAGGSTKKAAVLNGILAGAKIGEMVPVPQVAAISTMIDLFVSIFKALHVHGF
jgi:hypothetical protein